jgi:hypothetical protein
MSNLLSQASLVMIPSGYKEDVVYSQIPTSGAGDLSFTRASNGTRINSAGLVEVCPWNLAGYSEDFSNAVWTKARVTITANDTTAPNGTLTADKVSLNSGTNSKLIQQAYSQNGAFTQTVYAKAGTHNFIQLLVGSDATPYCNFDLVNGTYSASGCTASITSVGNGWFYLTMSYSTTIGTDYYLWAVDSLSSARADSTSSTGYYYVWGFQLNIGSTAKPYFPTTDRLNVPRLTYQNGGGGCPSLLLEKQSTNLVSYSQDFTQSSWQKLGQGIADTAVITANYAISPDGTQNATRFVCNLNGSSSASDRSWMIQTLTPQANSTISIWIKLNTSGTKNIIFSDGGGDIKTISGTDWQRIDTTFSGASGEFRIGLIGSTGSSDTLDCCIWGAQAESGSYPTSYIPTTSSSATRVADACFKTGISSLIGQTEGTMFADFVRTQSTSSDAFWFNISDNSVNNWIFFGLENTGGRFYVRASNTVIVEHYPAISLGRHKLAIGYKSGSIVGYVDGVQVFTSSSTFTIGSLTGISLGPQSAVLSTDVVTSGQVNQAILFPTRLTNAELASLTTI